MGPELRTAQRRRSARLPITPSPTPLYLKNPYTSMLHPQRYIVFPPKPKTANPLSSASIQAPIPKNKYADWCGICRCSHSLGWDANTAHEAEIWARDIWVDEVNADRTFGILIGLRHNGDLGVLRAYTPPIIGTAQAPSLAGCLPQVRLPLEAIRQTRIHLQRIDDLTLRLQENSGYRKEREAQLTVLNARHQRALEQRRSEVLERKTHRAHERRQNPTPARLAELRHESMRDGSAFTSLKRGFNAERKPIELSLDRANESRTALRRERRSWSQKLQVQLFNLGLTSDPAPPPAISESPSPALEIGFGLLYHASILGLKAQAMGVFQVRDGGMTVPTAPPANESSLSDHLGDLMCGLSRPRVTLVPADFQSTDLEVLYSDDAIIVINKPPGLLSVPGRHWTTADNAHARLARRFKSTKAVLLVHRLDQETSGIMVFARTHQAQKALSQQFMKRTVEKTYLALVDGRPKTNSGVIRLPLSSDRSFRPSQRVDLDDGKPAETHFKLKSMRPNGALLELKPVTGRTHQLRVHCASPQGLDRPIKGDDIYGQRLHGERLHLHAWRLSFRHPTSHDRMTHSAQPDF